MTYFRVCEYKDNGTEEEHDYTPREFALWLQYLHPNKRLRDYKERDVIYRFTIVDALVSVRRLV